MEVTLSSVNSNETELLRQLAIQTFEEAFGSDNSEQHMRDYVTLSFSIDQLTSELQNPESSFLFARYGHEVVGYLKLNWGVAQTEQFNQTSLEVERIYVLKNYQGNQIGQRFLDYAISTAQEKNVEFIWLGVWEENTKALRFYKKNGFAPFGTHSFMLGSDKQTDLLLKKVVGQLSV
jgi:ribosomal protein S18 acetylase RimI-like enzyme